MKESIQSDLQELAVAGPEANRGLGNTLEILKKEELNTQYLQNQEEIPKYQVVNSDNKRKQRMKKRTRAHLGNSSYYHQKKQKRYSARNEINEKLLTDGYNHSFLSDKDSLQITLIQSQFLEKEDHFTYNKSSSSRLSERGHGRKQKIYETDEFIDYLLNYYYQIPNYTSVCLEPSHTISTCQWQKSVYARGNGFQIHLRKHKHPSTRLNQMQNLERREQAQEDEYGAKIYTQRPAHKPQKRGKVDYTKECTKKFKNHCKDTASEAVDQLTTTYGKSYLLEKTHAYQINDSACTGQNQVSSPNKRADLDLELTDFLEEISSDSECFSETLSVNQEEEQKSVATYDRSPEKRSLDADEIITCNQEVTSSQQTLYSKWKHDGEKKYSKYQLRKPSKRSKYELRCSGLEGENTSMRNKSDNKKRKTLASKYFDEGYYHESSCSDLLDHITRKRRKFNDNIFDQKVNYRPSCVPITSSKYTNAFYLGYFPQRRETLWKSEYNQDARRFKRHDNSTDFMLTSDNYYIRHNSQGHINYRNYLRNNYTSSLYFQMF